jgi:hypothetical protein
MSDDDYIGPARAFVEESALAYLDGINPTGEQRVRDALDRYLGGVVDALDVATVHRLYAATMLYAASVATMAQEVADDRDLSTDEVIRGLEVIELTAYPNPET